MNERNLNIDLIEKYLDNNLGVKEANFFLEKIEHDEEFVRELNDMELLIDGIKKAAKLTSMEEKLERFEISMKLMENDDDEKANQKTIFFNFNLNKKYYWTIAASVTLFMVASITFFSINQTPSNRILYEAYFSPLENYGNKRSMEKEAENTWKLALVHYDNAQYELALDNFNKVMVSEYIGTIHYPSLPLYKGNTLMKLNRHHEAMRIFEDMLEDDDGMIIQAKWYLSMCYLFENNTGKLIPLLEDIANVQASSYSQKAQKILKQIDF